MFNEGFEQFFERVLFESLGEDTEVISYQFLSGGCINISAKLLTEAGYFFVKWNETAPSDLFEKEAIGLQILKESDAAQIPTFIKYGKVDGKHFLLLEYVEPSHEKEDFWEDFGVKIAKLHSQKCANFGLVSDNYIGSLLQTNVPSKDWFDFFLRQRLMAQAGLAYYNQLLSKEMLHKLEKLGEKLPSLLVNEPPSLIHGDLWSGNFIPGNNGEVCLIDPAVYYANREIEIAFTMLFGGFDNRFYSSYFEALPVEKGFAERSAIYNLYPLLVHVNLFGGSYVTGVEKVLKKYI